MLWGGGDHNQAEQVDEDAFGDGEASHAASMRQPADRCGLSSRRESSASSRRSLWQAGCGVNEERPDDWPPAGHTRSMTRPKTPNEDDNFQLSSSPLTPDVSSMELGVPSHR